MKPSIREPDHVPQSFRQVILLLSVASCLLLLSVLLTAGYHAAPLQDTQVRVLSDGWVDASGNSVTLPSKDYRGGQNLYVETTLPPGDGTPRSLLFFVKYQNANLLWNGELLTTMECQPLGYSRTVGKVFSIVPLPQEGGTLRIEAEPLLGDDIAYELAAPKVGSGEALIYGMVAEELPGLLITAAIFCFGIFMLCWGIQAVYVGLVHRDDRAFQSSFLHIGLFALLFALYYLVSTDTIHLFFQDPYPLYLLEFFLLALLPFAPLALAAEVCAWRFRWLLAADCCLLVVNLAGQTVAHFAFDFEPRLGVRIVHVLIVLSVVLLIPALASARRGKGGWWWPLLSFSPVLLGVLVDLYRYYQPVFYEEAMGCQLGVMAFLLLQTGYLIRQDQRHYKSHLLSSTYRQMAYTDALTGLPNRAAFQDAVTQVETHLDRYSSVWCISADLNDLKQTNDTLGHASGDALIRAAGAVLREAAGPGATVYRMGGDEFAVLLFNRSEAELRSLCDRVEEATAQHDRALPPELHLSLALGYDRFHFAVPDTMADLLCRADAQMYLNKQEQKRRPAPEPLREKASGD